VFKKRLYVSWENFKEKDTEFRFWSEVTEGCENFTKGVKL